MSGGYFGYDQHRIAEMAYGIQGIIDNNNNDSVDVFGDTVGRQYAPEVIDRLNDAVDILNKAFVYAQRVDWLLSSDDSELAFINRLNEELEGLDKC